MLEGGREGAADQLEARPVFVSAAPYLRRGTELEGRRRRTTWRIPLKMTLPPPPPPPPQQPAKGDVRDG